MEATVLAGIDWATKEHQVFVTDAAGKKLFEGRVPQTAADLAALSSRLIELAGGDPRRVAVAIERPHGLVVEALASRGIRIFAINPKQLDRFRDRFSPSGAKDDRRDAEVLCSSLRTDRRAFREVEPTAPLIVELCEWSRMRHEEQCERTRLCNRLREQLLRYFPQMLELDADPGKPWMLALLRRVRTPKHAMTLDLRSIAPILKKHRIRKVSAKDVLEILGSGIFQVAEGVTGAAVAHIEHLSARIEVLNDQVKASEKHCRPCPPRAKATSACSKVPTHSSRPPPSRASGLPRLRSCAPCPGSAPSCSAHSSVKLRSSWWRGTSQACACSAVSHR